MRYSSPLEIIAMTLLWAAVLIVYDITFNKYLFQLTPGQIEAMTTPQVSMWIQHIGCTPGKTEEAVQELQQLPWLSNITVKRLDEAPEMVAEGAVKRPEEQKCDIGVISNVQNIEQADFMQIYGGLRARHIVPTTFEFGGIPHFALKAKVANLCDTCMRVAMEALTPRKDLKSGSTFKWLDSKRINQKDGSITAFARFNNEAHINEMIGALEGVGLPPLSIHIVIE